MCRAVSGTDWHVSGTYFLGQPRKRFARTRGCVIRIHRLAVLRITILLHFTPNLRKRSQLRDNNFARNATSIGKPRGRRTAAVPKLNTVMNIEIRQQSRANRRVERTPHTAKRRCVATSTKPRLRRAKQSTRLRRLPVYTVPSHPQHKGRRFQRLFRARTPHFHLCCACTRKRQPFRQSCTHPLQHRSTLGWIHSHRFLLRVRSIDGRNDHHHRGKPSNFAPSLAITLAA